MRIAEHDNKYESNQTTESQSFGIGDPSVVIEILRNRLYEHKIRTLVQEYMSNARDAHREVSQSRRIEVVAPTQLEPTFKVRDFGPGISPDRMANVFVLYGASTKRANNTQTGGFGIGAKSAWSYADGFIIVSTVDGIRRTYHAHVGQSNVGQLDLIETTNTDQPNGCEIQIAVNPRDVSEFNQSIQRACYFWSKEETPMLKNIVLPIMVQGYELGNLLVVDQTIPSFLGSTYRSNLLVIDGIPYALTEDLHEKVQQLKDLRSELNSTMIIRIPNGLVQVSASREKLDDSEFTRKGLAKVGTKILTDVKSHVASKINALTTVKEFVTTYLSMYKFFVMQNNEYKGFKFDGQYLYTSLLNSVTFRCLSMDKSRRSSTAKLRNLPVKGIPVAEMNNIFLVTKDEGTMTMNRRIRAALLTQPNLYIIEERSTELIDKTGVVQQLKFDVPPAKAIKDLQDILGKFHDFHAITFVMSPRTPKALKAAKLASQQNIHYLSGHGRDTKAETVQQMSASGLTYVYLQISEWQEHKEKYNEVIAEFRGDRHDSKNKRPIFIGVSNETLGIIQGEAGFIPYKDWFDTVALDNSMRLRMMHAKALNFDVIEKLSQLDAIKNKKLTVMVDHYKIMKKAWTGNNVPKVLVDMFKDDAEYQKFLLLDAALKALIKSRYALVYHMDRYSGAEYKAEMTWYLNNK